MPGSSLPGGAAGSESWAEGWAYWWSRLWESRVVSRFLRASVSGDGERAGEAPARPPPPGSRARV